MPINVLICSAARKVWLVNAFRDAQQGRGGKVLVCDADPLAAALCFADQIVDLPRLDDPSFEAALLGACHEQNIHLIVPTRDSELIWFAERRLLFRERGVEIAVSAVPAIAICQDKLHFIDHCHAHGFSVPKTLRTLGAAGKFPLYARPRIGSGGRGAGAISSAQQLAALEPWDDWLVQELIDAPEFTLDLFADLQGRVLSVVPRQRLRVQFGESTVAVTVDAPYLIERAAALAQSLGLVGHNTLQCFMVDVEPLWIEINPRFGGGAALGFAAGAHTPRLLLQLLAGERLEPRLGCYERDLYMYRYSCDHYVRGAKL